MERWLEIKNYLTDHGFTSVTERQSPFFGDQYSDFVLNDTLIRLSISRSFFNIEFFHRLHPNDAYDIEIIMTYFSEPYSTENEIIFLKNHLPEVMNVFSTSYFAIAKPKLDKLKTETCSKVVPRTILILYALSLTDHTSFQPVRELTTYGD